jgi:hypothetical protein
VWVRTDDGEQVAGLLTQWCLEPLDQSPGDRPAGHRAVDGPAVGEVWVGLVVYVSDVDGQPLLVQAWVPADRLRPARTS